MCLLEHMSLLVLTLTFDGEVSGWRSGCWTCGLSLSKNDFNDKQMRKKFRYFNVNYSRRRWSWQQHETREENGSQSTRTLWLPFTSKRQSLIERKRSYNSWKLKEKGSRLGKGCSF
ncbi:hypothetical protein M758_8G073800 [Ceratodon purpureus]|nr:hypothetical protein M758_8G073800 [Ceratodon purpureus]